ncbi:uncharacterized protein LOC126666297 [Mercurialis annua]|uniref:uncharacterized protein LOC126666297 n=1 Tax=Mercurialis annua TaxID=3986 RepID=UPI00215FBFD7|nr:uncharacterized protein LOC126666297 [Mercurialis annua]
MSLWTIWIDTNNLVFGNKRLSLEFLFQQVTSDLSHKSSLDRISKVLSPAEALSWIPPTGMMIKVNTDAAVSVRNNSSVVSAVCRNAQGAVIRWGVSAVHGITDAEAAEARAVQLGLQISAQFQEEEIILESDSSNVISRLNNSKNAIDLVHIIIDDCLMETVSRRVHFRHIQRQCNQVAHALAKWGVFIGKNIIVDGNVPFPVNELVNSEISYSSSFQVSNPLEENPMISCSNREMNHRQ